MSLNIYSYLLLSIFKDVNVFILCFEHFRTFHVTKIEFAIYFIVICILLKIRNLHISKNISLRIFQINETNIKKLNLIKKRILLTQNNKIPYYGIKSYGINYR